MQPDPSLYQLNNYYFWLLINWPSFHELIQVTLSLLEARLFDLWSRILLAGCFSCQPINCAKLLKAEL